jgi:hypothetical protein
MEDDDQNVVLNVRDWIILSTTMIAAVLTILALIWQVPPTRGIVTVTFLLMVSFILFVNSVSSNSRANFELKLKNYDEKKVNRFISFAEYTFGMGFTLVIIGFSILGYVYLLDFVGQVFYALLLPIVFLVVAWAMIIIYNTISYSGKAFKGLRSIKRNLWVIMEFICLVAIFLDFFLIPYII